METAARRRALELFLYLQVLDVMSTLIGFSLGNEEASPFVRLLVRFGPLAGLAISKLFAVALVILCYRFDRLSLFRWINYWYGALVLWNLFVAIRILNS